VAIAEEVAREALPRAERFIARPAEQGDATVAERANASVAVRKCSNDTPGQGKDQSPVRRWRLSAMLRVCRPFSKSSNPTGTNFAVCSPTLLPMETSTMKRLLQATAFVFVTGVALVSAQQPAPNPSAPNLQPQPKANPITPNPANPTNPNNNPANPNPATPGAPAPAPLPNSNDQNSKPGPKETPGQPSGGTAPGALPNSNDRNAQPGPKETPGQPSGGTTPAPATPPVQPGRSTNPTTPGTQPSTPGTQPATPGTQPTTPPAGSQPSRSPQK
jgi:hypothetical protein